LGFSALIFAAWAMIADDPFGGEPVAVAPAALVAATPVSKPEQAGPADLATSDPRNSHDSPPVDSLAAAPPVNRTVTIIDGTSGKRQEIVIPGAADFGSMDQQPPEGARRGGVAKAAPSTRAPGRSTPAP
jgi:hypothetical protein